ncbi:MAG: type II toxin-antitoxin system HicB family antitoxin [Dehalococcoidales bacterium]|jgi:predicted RNase H-like HicB family nuclease
MMSDHKPTIEFKIEIVIEPDEGGYHAYCPALKGLHTSGETREEALQNARETAIVYLESLIKHGEPIPVGVSKRASYSAASNISRYKEELKVACAI